VAVESADPRWLAASSDALVAVTGRVRAVGSIAISLCQVAATRVDGMATLWKCRAVDAAAAQLIVRESGGLVAFTAMEEPLGAPLDLVPHSPVVAARTERALAELATLPSG
jgi:myo-inositol-1(or 4)-monophosphatase